jgi:hypothetical protein
MEVVSSKKKENLYGSPKMDTMSQTSCLVNNRRFPIFCINASACPLLSNSCFMYLVAQLWLWLGK